jgi:hypothetical protein
VRSVLLGVWFTVAPRFVFILFPFRSQFVPIVPFKLILESVLLICSLGDHVLY